MGLLISILILVYVLVCGFLILVVLLQSGKGGGLSGLLSGGGGLSDSFGASGAEKTLSNWTTYCAIAFLVVSLALTLLGARHFQKSLLGEFPEETPPPPSAQVTPAQMTPAQVTPAQMTPAQVTPAQVTPRSEETIPGSPERVVPVQPEGAVPGPSVSEEEAI